jgi:hypothetical protein
VRWTRRLLWRWSVDDRDDPPEPWDIVVTAETKDEAIAEALRQLRADGDVGELTIHEDGCGVDEVGEGCDCEPLVLVTGAEA